MDGAAEYGAYVSGDRSVLERILSDDFTFSSPADVGLDRFDQVLPGRVLKQVGADPYSYRLVEGVVIFIAMYADALKTGHVDSGGGRLFRKG